MSGPQPPDPLADPAVSAAAATFEHERPQLVGLAYRITGSQVVAEDLVQEAWLRWQLADRDAIVRPGAWLTTVVSRLALDHLRSAAHQRTTYVGPWLPEPVAVDPDPAERAELAESLTIGFLAMLERLGPTERVVFLLADVFGVPFDEVAEIVGRSPAACRQVASRARVRVREGRPRFAATDDEAWQVAVAFLTAAQVGDLDALLALLADDALAVSDGGAHARAARRPVVGDRIARFVANLAARIPTTATVSLRAINGSPGLVVEEDGVVTTAMAVEVADGLVTRIWTVRNPDKLRSLAAQGR
jgi:RNA polymerase sigma-70 factor (ECF subfamily)